ncbi:LrgB family protein [Acinetobacter rudis]|uniref:LrgB family protein n=1 Tax=Acinetobacter rudis TaxID=632955 RepID=A0AAW8J842_9GAMM|nr:LrgB family protein [Acinetobacter rudis]MDQ8935355.1 LrgB family protein [Acinetobacter rudis]MDQ9017618.1 LrgB family protein [Acinetobacter rudis]
MNTMGILFLGLTLVLYILCKKLFLHTQKIILSPIILVSLLSIVVLVIFDRPYAEYHMYNQYLVTMLGPVTVAFAIPMYNFRAVIRQHFKVLILSSCIAMVVGVLSSWIFAVYFDFDTVLTNSLLARSISIPFALALTEQIGGSISLVPLFTVITGLVGMVIGDFILLMLGFNHYLANGAAWGNAAHAMGIACAQQRHPQEAVIASLSMILSGIMMVLFGPFVIGLFL